MKRPRSETVDKFDLQMTAMIDVVFQLLIFFMCGTKFKMPEGRVDAFLPKDLGQNPGEMTAFDSIVIRIGKGGSGHAALTVNNQPCRGYLELLGQLQKLKQLMPSPKVILDPDPLVPHDFVMHALDTCRRGGLLEVAFRAPLPPR